MTVKELPAKDLYRATDPARFDFETTADLPPFEGALGQPRAMTAVEFGIGVRRDGYNIFVLGPGGLGKHHLIRNTLEKEAPGRPIPPDWCYVHNFEDATKPRLLKLPPGRGQELRRDLESLVEEISAALATTFESEEYHARREALEEEFRERQKATFEELQEEARSRGLATLRTPVGIVFAPTKDDEVISPEDFQKLPEEERQRLQKEIETLQQDLQKALRQMPRWQREARQRVGDLNREVIRYVVGPHFEDLRKSYADLPEVVAHLEALEQDVVEHARDFLASDDGGAAGNPDGGGSALPRARHQDGPLRRYAVNLLVDHSRSEAAPIVHENNPNYHNLVGRVEHLSQMGTLVTDFLLIKAGALQRANGGYLILEAERLLRQPFSWEALKRALQSRQARIESLAQAYSLVSTVSLEPEPMPLDLKVVVIGEPILYYLLSSLDPDFPRLFKVAADFDDRMQRTAEQEQLYARLIATMARQEDLLPLDRGAVARVLEQGARSLGDSERLTAHTAHVHDLLCEADHLARQEGRPTVTREDVDRAIEARIHRSDRLRDRLQEEILRGTLYIDTSGEAVGQVNGLSVLQLGGFSFGQPSRITARVWMGKGEVVDIEREVELSGPIHSKGVLILSSFLSARYASDEPLSLAASLVFEQSYGGVEGDSASSAELYALLSAIAGVPLRQSLAVTGSVNQHGRVQPIGGVNEKVEGFFDICSARGLDGSHGVLIPSSNVKHLMLRRDVVEAVEAGRFHLYPIDHVDQGIELLTGLAAGETDASGAYPEGTINRLVEERLAELGEKRKEFGAALAGGRAAAGNGGGISEGNEP